MRDIKIFNMSQHSAPQYNEVIYSSKPYVLYGDDNNYPNYLISLLNSSGKHNAIVKTKASMIGGNGLDRNGLSNEALIFIRNPYNKLTLDEISARIAYDLEVFGAFTLCITWAKNKTTIAEIQYINPSNVRIGKEDVNGVPTYFVSSDWNNERVCPPVEFAGFNTNVRKGKQILYVKEYVVGSEFYGHPGYLAGVNWISLEYEVSTYHLNSVINGFHPSMMINMVEGIPNEEEMDETIRTLRKQYESAVNAGKVFFTFTDGQDKAPILTPIEPNNSDERFISLNKEITQGIMVAHQVVSPALFGVTTEGSLGDKNNLIDSLQIFQAQYIDPKQKLIEDILNKLARINNIQDNIVLNTYQIKFNGEISSGEMLSILESTLSSQQKINILMSYGYTEDTAKKIVLA
jgi:hypothetical protein